MNNIDKHMISIIKKGIDNMIEFNNSMISENENANYPEKAGAYLAALEVTSIRLKTMLDFINECTEADEQEHTERDPFGVIDLLNEATKIR